MSKYHASLIGGQNIVFRPYIDVSDTEVKFRIPGILSGEKQTMLISSISDIQITGSILNKTIIIHATGIGAITAEGFSSSDANSIQREIESNRNRLQQRQQKSSRYEDNDWPEEEPERLTRQEDLLTTATRQFSNKNYVPLITFSSNSQELFAQLNSLVHYANEVKRSKEFDDFTKEKLMVFIDKIKQGVRIAESMDYSNNPYLQNEVLVIKKSLSEFEEYLNTKNKGKRRGRIIKWVCFAIVVLYMFKACH